MFDIRSIVTIPSTGTVWTLWDNKIINRWRHCRVGRTLALTVAVGYYRALGSAPSLHSSCMHALFHSSIILLCLVAPRYGEIVISPVDRVVSAAVMYFVSYPFIFSSFHSFPPRLFKVHFLVVLEILLMPYMQYFGGVFFTPMVLTAVLAHRSYSIPRYFYWNKQDKNQPWPNVQATKPRNADGSPWRRYSSPPPSPPQETGTA